MPTKPLTSLITVWLQVRALPAPPHIPFIPVLGTDQRGAMWQQKQHILVVAQRKQTRPYRAAPSQDQQPSRRRQRRGRRCFDGIGHIQQQPCNRSLQDLLARLIAFVLTLSQAIGLKVVESIARIGLSPTMWTQANNQGRASQTNISKPSKLVLASNLSSRHPSFIRLIVCDDHVRSWGSQGGSHDQPLYSSLRMFSPASSLGFWRIVRIIGSGHRCRRESRSRSILPYGFEFESRSYSYIN
jgi:hypothetical protein